MGEVGDFLVDLEAKSFYFPDTTVKPHSSIYQDQDIIFTINKHFRKILSVVRTATTLVNVSQFRGIRLNKWGLRGKQNVTGLKGRETLGNNWAFFGDIGGLMKRKATESTKSSRIVQERLESWSACYWVSWWARLTTSLLAGGKIAGICCSRTSNKQMMQFRYFWIFQKHKKANVFRIFHFSELHKRETGLRNVNWQLYS